MITHERLKELIEQGAKIWCICDYTYHKNKPNKKIEYYDLSSEDVCISPAEFRDYGLRIYNSLGYWNDVRYENLFETKEEAEWHKEFGCIERTERLDLPTWEEFISNTNGVEFNRINGDKIRFHKLSGDKVFTMYDKNGKIHFEREWFLTKENYYKACRKAKELFLGEVDERN